jgi:hypothetical protein
MLYEDGANNELILRIVKYKKNRFEYLADKTLCRLMLLPNKVLTLLPKYFDKLKNYTKVVNLWRYKLCQMHNMK